MTEKKPWRNRKERKEWGRRLQSEDPGLEVVHAHAAGSMLGTACITLLYDRIAIHNRCAGLSVSLQICIA
jgi:hypothetical protein